MISFNHLKLKAHVMVVTLNEKQNIHREQPKPINALRLHACSEVKHIVEWVATSLDVTIDEAAHLILDTLCTKKQLEMPSKLNELMIKCIQLWEEEDRKTQTQRMEPATSYYVKEKLRVKL